MLSVSAINAKPGMVLAAPLHHPDDPCMVLLQPDVVLDETLIHRLIEIHAGEMWVKYPGIEFIAENYHPQVHRAQVQLMAMFSAQLDAIARTTAGHGLVFDKLQSAVGQLLKAFVRKPKSAVFVRDIAQRDKDALRHGSTVCMLSLLLGLQLEHYIISERRRTVGLSGKSISCLGLGAMLHDIGMLRLDSAVRTRWQNTRDRSDPDWQRHVMVGYDIVKGQLSPAAAGVVLHHHQSYDGSGFPYKTSPNGVPEPVVGKDIHVFARICAVADAFDRLRLPTNPDLPAMPTVGALRIMIERACAGEFDPIVVHGLVRIAPAFAPGTIVHLTTGQDCVVTEWQADNPCRPTVLPIDTHRSILSRQYDSMVEPEPIDLARDLSVSIMRVGDVDVTGYLFGPDAIHSLIVPTKTKTTKIPSTDTNTAAASQRISRTRVNTDDDIQLLSPPPKKSADDLHTSTKNAPAATKVPKTVTQVGSPASRSGMDTSHETLRHSATKLTRHPPAA